MKNRLADLIRVALMANIDKSCRLAENIADYLFENGVIVPLISGKGETELKPCPFCGGTAEIVYAYYDVNQYSVRCKQCGVCVTTDYTSDTEKESVRHWNRRIEQ